VLTGCEGNRLKTETNPTAIALTKDEHEIAQFEWIEGGRSYREWLIPASLINDCGTTTIEEIDEVYRMIR